MRRLLLLISLALLITACSRSHDETTVPSQAPVEIRPVTPAELTPLVVPTNTPPGPTLAPGVQALPRFADLGPQWSKFLPGDPTICAHGGPYAFWARQGASNNLLIYFEPGGACWNAETCSQDGSFYKG